MSSRRQFIKIVPVVPLTALGGMSLLAACGEKAAPPAAAPAPAGTTPPAAAMPPAPAPAAPPAVATPTPAAPVPATPSAMEGSSTTAGGMVDESSPAAKGLGYVSDAAKADKAKYPTLYIEGAKCGNCSLYQGAAGSEAGACPLYPGKQVSAKGWCSAYAKKAA